MHIFFDIDNTLVNTDVLRPYLEGGVEIERGSFYEGLPYGESLYEETEEVLRALKRRGYSLGVFSAAQDLTYQRMKLERSGIIDYFDPQLIYIGEKKDVGACKERLAEKLAQESGLQLSENGSLVIVDDRPDVLEKFSACFPQAITVRVKRGKHQDMESEFIPDHEISDLKGLLEIVEKVNC